MSIDESKNTYLYRLTDVYENFSLENVHSILVSISLKNLNSHTYSVDVNEVEDIILSLENWNENRYCLLCNSLKFYFHALCLREGLEKYTGKFQKHLLKTLDFSK